MEEKCRRDMGGEKWRRIDTVTSADPQFEMGTAGERVDLLSWDTDLLSPGTLVNVAHGASSSGGVESSRHLSRSNIDIPRSNGVKDPKRQWPRKRSDSSTYELDTIQQHQAFLSSLHANVLRNEPSSHRSSSSTMLYGSGAVGKFDYEIADLFLFGCPLGLVLALRKSVIPALDVFQLRAACQQVYSLFHPADPSASRWSTAGVEIPGPAAFQHPPLPTLPAGARLLHTAGRRTPDQQHGLSRAHVPLLAQCRHHHPRLPPSQ